MRRYTKQAAKSRRSRGEGGFRRRKDGLWEFTLSLGKGANGKRVRVSFYGRKQCVAARKMLLFQQAISGGLNIDLWRRRFTVGGWMAQWFDATRAGRSRAHQLACEGAWRLISPRLGHVRLDKLRAMHIDVVLVRMGQEGMTADRLWRARKVLSAGLRHAVRVRLLPSNPCDESSPVRRERKEMRTWEATQVRRFLDGARDERLYALFVLAIDSGMRLGELAALHWHDVDFATASVTVQRAISSADGRTLGPPKTAASKRRIMLTDFAVLALRDHRRSMQVEGFDASRGPVFCDVRGRLLSREAIRTLFYGITDRVNRRDECDASASGATPDPLPRIRFHDLRHTCATLLLLAGTNPKVIQERLGHSSIVTTLDTYAHCLPTMQAGAAEKLNQLFGGPTVAKAKADAQAPPVPPGQTDPEPALSGRQNFRIRKMRAMGFKEWRIALDMGLDVATVYRCLRQPV